MVGYWKPVERLAEGKMAAILNLLIIMVEFVTWYSYPSRKRTPDVHIKFQVNSACIKIEAKLTLKRQD